MAGLIWKGIGPAACRTTNREANQPVISAHCTHMSRRLQAQRKGNIAIYH